MTSTRFAGALLALSTLAGACGSEAAGPAATFPAIEADRCVVMLHGKGGNGLPAENVGDVVRLYPAGNGEGWGARQWSYEDGEDYASAVGVVEATLDASRCKRAVIHGFSNGGAFAAKVYCEGDNLDGRLVGVVIDDPVTDATTAACAPDPAVDAVLYWTGDLEQYVGSGRGCSGLDWTCAGGTVIPVEAYAAAAGLEVIASPLSEHERYDAAPEPLEWLAAAG